MTPLCFDTVFHLFGEQTIPNYMGIRLCQAVNHVAVVTERTEGLVPRVEASPGLGPGRVQTLQVEAYDMAALTRVLQSEVQKRQGERLGFNVTGGTKPMFAAAMAACQACQGTAFYIDTARRTLDPLFPISVPAPLPPVFSRVDEFVTLAGYRICKGGFWSDVPARARRAGLTRACWSSRTLLAQHQWEISKYNRPPFHGFRTGSDEGKRRFLAELHEEGWRATLTMGDATWTVNDWKDFAVYLSGGWLEEYVYLLLEPLLANGAIRDLRIGLCPSWDGKVSDHALDAQEFDVCFTDGYDLTIVECKAGAIQQGAVQKLENLTRRFGGAFGRGIMVAANRQSQPVLARLRNSHEVASFVDAAVPGLAERIASVRPGEVVGQQGAGWGPDSRLDSGRPGRSKLHGSAGQEGQRSGRAQCHPQPLRGYQRGAGNCASGAGAAPEAAIPAKGDVVWVEVVTARPRENGPPTWRLRVAGGGQETEGVFADPERVPPDCAVGKRYRCVVRGSVRGNMAYEWRSEAAPSGAGRFPDMARRDT